MCASCSKNCSCRAEISLFFSYTPECQPQGLHNFGITLRCWTLHLSTKSSTNDSPTGFSLSDTSINTKDSRSCDHVKNGERHTSQGGVSLRDMVGVLMVDGLRVHDDGGGRLLVV